MIAATNAALEEKQLFAEQIRRAEVANTNNINITAAMTKSWTKWEQLTSILDTGYSERNMITPVDAWQVNLPSLEPSWVGIIEANSGMPMALQKTRVNWAGLLPEARHGIIAPEVQYSLRGGTNFANQGFIRIFCPHYTVES